MKYGTWQFIGEYRNTLLLKFPSGKEIVIKGILSIMTFFHLEGILEEEQKEKEGIFLDLSGFEEVIQEV